VFILLIVLPVVFVVYMLTKPESNCNIAWVLSWSKIHPCWVDLGPSGSNWEFPERSNQDNLAHVAYTYCSYIDHTVC
jgi:hypothetical protein